MLANAQHTAFVNKSGLRSLFPILSSAPPILPSAGISFSCGPELPLVTIEGASLSSGDKR